MVRRMDTPGKRIKYLRTAVLGLETQTPLAKLLHVSRVAVGNWEKDLNGIDDPNADLLARLAGTTRYWIQDGEGPTPPARVRGESPLSPLNENVEFTAGDSPLLLLASSLVAFAPQISEARLSLEAEIDLLQRALDILEDPEALDPALPPAASYRSLFRQVIRSILKEHGPK